MCVAAPAHRQSGTAPIFTHRKEDTDEASHYPVAGSRTLERFANSCDSAGVRTSFRARS